MSLVTTPRRRSPSSRHSAAIRLLLPDPTGPPIPTRRALAGKEALLSLLVDGCGELEGDRRRRGLVGERPVIVGDRAGGECHRRRQRGEPARRDGGVERQQLERGRSHGGGVVVQGEQRGGL